MDPSIPDECMINSLIEKHGEVWVCTRCGKTAHDARTKANLKRHIEVKPYNNLKRHRGKPYEITDA